MNSLDFRRYSSTISTGKVLPNTQVSTPVKKAEPTTAFSDVLKEQLGSTGGLTFTNHAKSRVEDRNIDLSNKDMDRLNEGLQIAKDKGLDQTLILMDKNAFIVSAKNNKVITTMGHSDLLGNVITNIQGTVII